MQRAAALRCPVDIAMRRGAHDARLSPAPGSGSEGGKPEAGAAASFRERHI